MLGVAGVASILAFVPEGRLLYYEQFALAKELLLPLGALLPAVVLLASARRLIVSLLDVVVVVGLMLVVGSALVQDTSVALCWRGLNVAVASAAVFFVARRTREDARLVMLLGLAVVLGALTVVAEAYGLLPRLSLGGRAPGGTEGNRNFMAHALVVGLPALLVLGLGEDRRLIRTVSLAGASLVVVAVVSSRSRTAWLGLAVLVLVAGVAWAATGLVRAYRRRFAVLAAMLVAGVLVAVLVPNRLHWKGANPYVDTLSSLADYHTGTGRGRIIQYRNTLSLIAAHPLLGVGPGNWSRAYPEHATPDDPSHRPGAMQPVNRLPNSDWLGLAAERGIPAVLAHAALLVSLALGWASRLRAAGSSKDALWPGVLLGAVGAVAVMGALDAVLLRPTPALLAFALFGLGAPRFRPLAALPGPRLAAVGALVLALWLTFDAGRRLLAHQLGQRRDVASLETAVRVDPTAFQLRAMLAVRLYNEGRCDETIDHAERVMRDYPHLPILRRLVESCRRRTPSSTSERDPP